MKYKSKTNIAFGFLFFLCIILIITSIVKKEVDTKIIMNPQYISMYHTDDLESFKISVLTTTPEIHHFQSENVSFVNVENDQETVSLKLKEINTYDDQYQYHEQEYYVVDFIFELPFKLENREIQINDANIKITYANGDHLKLYIGEFNYIFKTPSVEDIILSNLSATYQYIDDVETVSGVNISLSNITDSNITIIDIDLLSTNVHMNFGKAVEREECYYKDEVSFCLGEEVYDFEEILEQPQSFLHRSGNTIDLYIPMVYLDDSVFLYRFPIIVTYMIQGEMKELVIDDFPFMNKGIYLEEMEGGYREATIYQNK